MIKIAPPLRMNAVKGTPNRMSENQHANRSGGLTAVDDFTGAAEGGDRAVVRDDQGLILTDKPDETAVLVGVSLARQPGILSMEDSLTELALLAETAGLAVQGSLSPSGSNVPTRPPSSAPASWLNWRRWCWSWAQMS